MQTMELGSHDSSSMDEYEKLVYRMNNTPSVAIDNGVCPTATIIKVNSTRKHGILLEAVRLLADLNLSIKKAYVSRDGSWFMDVFHVTDETGEKLTDNSVIRYIEQCLGTIYYGGTIGYTGLTSLELTGADRIGLMSELFAVLADMQCSVVDAKVWTRNGRIASLVYVKDRNSGTPIECSQQINRMEARLRNVLKGDQKVRSTRMSVLIPVAQTERRLHQLMFADRDYERVLVAKAGTEPPVVTVQNWAYRGYSVVNVQCKDRRKLLFDVLCALTDMQYVVFHASINTSADNNALLEFYIRNVDGTPISSEADRLRVIQCLEVAVERIESEGVRLELRTPDRPGLLADIIRTFHENGLNISKAEISTRLDTAFDVFYVTVAMRNSEYKKIIEEVRQRIGLSELQATEVPSVYHRTSEREEEAVSTAEAMLLSLGRFVHWLLHRVCFASNSYMYIKEYRRWLSRDHTTIFPIDDGCYFKASTTIVDRINSCMVLKKLPFIFSYIYTTSCLKQRKPYTTTNGFEPVKKGERNVKLERGLSWVKSLTDNII